MEYRTLGRTGWNISEIGFGSWGIGGNEWGATDDSVSLAALNLATTLGVLNRIIRNTLHDLCACVPGRFRPPVKDKSESAESTVANPWV